MALQGTIDTFPVADVLTLIASSARSGQLTLTGDRGTVSLWLNRDVVVAGQISGDRVASPERAVFELLRFTEGSFVFESVPQEDFPDFDVEPVPTDSCLAGARAMSQEWERIEALVPSASHRVGLVAELPGPDVTIDASTWRILVNITRSSSVGHLALELGLDDHDCSVLVAALVEEGLVEVTDPWDLDALLADEAVEVNRPEQDHHGHRDVDVGSTEWATADGDVVDLPAATDSSQIPDPVITPHGSSWSPDAGGDGTVGTAEFPEHFPIDDLIPDTLGVTDDPWGVDQTRSGGDVHGTDGSEGRHPEGSDPVGWAGSDHDPTTSGGFPTESVRDEPVGAGSGDDSTRFVEQSEAVLRQMSTLSPSAAEAIAATLAGDEIEDPVPDQSGPRKRRGLFGTSGLFGSSGSDVSTDTDPPVEAFDESPDESAGTEPTESGGGTSISYLDSF